MTDPARPRSAGDDLLAAILADPADDLPRLVYADWLDEQGEGERAEFIRVQCELAQLDGGDRCCVCGWPYRGVGIGCVPGFCSYIPDGRQADYPEWHRKQTEYHTLRRRQRELFDQCCKVWFTNPTVPLGEWRWMLDDGRDYGRGPGWTVSRGFVSAVSLTLEAFLGGRPCQRCGDSDEVRSDHDGWFRRSECPACHGTGRTPDIAAALFSVAPVTGVTLTDREPYQTPFGRWRWFRDTDLPRSDECRWSVPKVLFDILYPTWPPLQRSEEPPHFATRSLAMSALSLACVNWGRSVAAGRWHERECDAIGVHRKDRCRGGRVLAPNAQFTRECSQCGGTGRVRVPGLPPLPSANG